MTAAPWITGDGYWSNPTFSADGRWLAVDDFKGAELWDVRARRSAATLARHSNPVFSPDSRLLASASGFPTEVAIWRVEDRARVATLNVGDVGGQALRFSPDSRLLAARGKDGATVQRFDAPGRHNISAPSSGGTSPGRNGTPRPRSRLPEGLPMTPAARGPR